MDFMAEKLGAVKDELERSAAAEREAERRKNDLVLYLAHDIKTPLTSIVSYVDLLKKEPMPTDQAKEYLDVLDRQAARLKKLIEDLVEAPRPPRGA